MSCSDLATFHTMDSIEDKDNDLNVFDDVETVSYSDSNNERYDQNQSKQAINDYEYAEEDESTDWHLTDSTEPTNSIKVGPKKRSKKTSKVTKRPKMSDDDDGVGTTKSKMITLGLKCSQNECQMMFESLKQLYQHQKSVHGVLPYPCLVDGCSEQFPNSHQIRSHYSTVHPRHSNWTCAQCNVKKLSSVQLRDHIRNFHQFGRFHCAYSVCIFEAERRVKVQNHQLRAHPHCICPVDGCGKAFGKNFKLKQHLCTHTNSTSSKVNRLQILELKCPQSDCEATFDTSTELQQHQTTVHNVLPFPCLVTECSKQFDSSVKISRHYSTVHPHHINWTCSKCEVVFGNKLHLAKHIRTVHQFGRFHCAHIGCAFEADVRSKVRNHYLHVHGGNVVNLAETSSTSTQDLVKPQARSKNRPMTIIKDDAITANGSNVIFDENKSQNSKMIIIELKCTQSECDMKFPAWDQLYQHQESVHGVLRYPCLATGCSEQFNSRQKVGHHIRIFHPNRTNWTCAQCNFECANPTRLRNHLKIHDNFGRFRCSQIGCVFEANNLIRMKNHFQTTHFRSICSIDGCGKFFPSKIALEKHQKSAHFAL